MKISDSSILKKIEEVVERSGADEILLFDTSLGRLFESNLTGRMVWELLDGRLWRLKDELYKL